MTSNKSNYLSNLPAMETDCMFLLSIRYDRHIGFSKIAITYINHPVFSHIIKIYLKCGYFF